MQTEMDLAARITDVEKSVKTLRRMLGAALLVICALSSLAVSPPQERVLRARGIIVEDSLGAPRVVIGAPVPLSGFTGEQAGNGVVVLSQSGVPQAALGSPTPQPRVDGQLGERAGGGSSGIAFYDIDGNERGGMGAFADGRANACVDYSRGVKEAVCMFVFPGDQMAGLTVNGRPGFGRDQANIMVNSAGLAQVKIASTGGRERAILKTDGRGYAELIVYDTVSNKYVNVMPSHVK